MKLLRKLLLVAAASGAIAGQGAIGAYAGPLLEARAANPVVQTNSAQPVELSDEVMDEVSSGIWVLVDPRIVHLHNTACSLLPSSYC
ncbi:MAG: hypothetical protein AAFY56_15910 [Pseudomonadota bacterium]